MTEHGRGSAAPAGDHLDLDALADVLAGERPEDPHLRRCASCADRLAELQAAEVAVVASLATLPDPEVPEGLAARLEAALRAEPALVGPAVAAAGARPQVSSARRGPVTSASVTTLPARRRRWLPAAAAAAVLVLAGALAWPVLQGSGAGGADTAASGGVGGQAESADETAGAPAASAVRNQSGIDYADEAQRDATLPQVLAGTATSSDALAALPESARAAEPVGPEPVGPESDGPAADGPASSSVAADPLARLRDPAALEDCLSALRPAGEDDVEPLALDYARFSGAPALAVVLPGDAPDKLALFVVGAGCSSAGEQLLLFARPDRP